MGVLTATLLIVVFMPQVYVFFFFFQAEDGIRDYKVTGVQTCALPICPGGMVDVEFAVQYLVLSQSAMHPGLMANLGNIALLQRAEEAGLLPAGVGQQAARAYRELRRPPHVARVGERAGPMGPRPAGPAP